MQIPVFIANSIDPDQTPHSAASDLGLHCLSVSLYGTVGINELMPLPGMSCSQEFYAIFFFFFFFVSRYQN